MSHPRVLAACLLALACNTTPGQRLPGEYYNEYHFNCATPHTPWAKPYAGGKIRVFVIAPTHAAREVTELWQRLDCEIGGETSITSGSLGYNGKYVSQVQGTSPAEKKQRVLRKLREPWDVYVLANFPIKGLPVEAQFEILKAVKFGAGLVMTYRRPAHEQIWRYALPSAQEIAREVPLAGLTFYRTTFPERVKVDRVADGVGKLIGGFRMGKGRVVQIDYGVESDVRIAGGFCLTPAELFTYRTVTEYNYHQSLVAKAVLWAGNREPSIRFTALPMDGFHLDSGVVANRIEIPVLNTTDGPVVGRLGVSVRNEWGKPEHSQQRRVSLQAGTSTIALDLPQLRGGTHFLDLRVASGRGVEGWASAALLVESWPRVAKVEMSKLSYARDESCAGSATLSGPCPAGDYRMRVALLDNYSRRFAQGERPISAGSQECSFRLPLAHAVSLAGRARATLVRGGVPLDTAETEFFVRQPEGDDFPALVWGNLPGIFGHYTAKQLHSIGFNAILHYYGTGLRGEGRRPVDIARQDFRAVPYTARIHWKDGLVMNRWSDQRFANSPKDRAALSRPYHPLVYSLGDENHLPDDACTHPSFKPAFVTFLEQRYPSLKELNASWGTSHTSFQDAVCIDRIGGRKHFARYHDMESFREKVYAQWHREWHDAVREVHPGARVGAEGSVPGELEVSIDGLEFWGPYRRPEQIALLRSLAPRSLIRGSWFGGYNHNRRDPTFLPRFVWSTVLDGNTLIEMYCSYTCENFYNTDLSFAYWMDWFLQDLKEITGGLGQLLTASDHLFDRVALYHSQPSLHLDACWAPFGRYDKAHRGALQMLEDLSFVPDYVTSRQVEKGLLRKKPLDLLILPHIAALSDREATEIRAYVERGGIVMADVVPGIANERCCSRGEGALDDLFGVQRDGGKVTPTTAEIAASGVKVSRVQVDGAIKPVETQPLPNVLLSRKCGAGRALLLNFSLHQYSTAGDDPWHQLVQGVLNELGVKPRWQVLDANGQPIAGCRASTFSRGSHTFLGVLGPRSKRTDAPTSVVLHAPGRAHIFDLRTGKYLGDMEETPLTLQQASATFLSALPYRPRHVQIAQCEWDAIARGIRIGWRLDGAGVPAHGSHVIRVKVFGPDEKERHYYARTLYPTEPRGEVLIPSALSDTAGTWRVFVRHVDTGLQSVATVNIPERTD